LNTTEYTDRKSIVAPATYLHTQFPKMSKEGGFQGYLFIHPNAIHGQLICPNKFANATNMNAIMDPILDKMISMPGIDPKSLIKLGIPAAKDPVDKNTASSLLGGLMGGIASSSSNAPQPAIPRPPSRIQRRHGPGEKMLYGMGIYDQDSRLLGEKELNDPRLAEVIEKAIPFDKPDGQIRVHLTAGGKVNEDRNDTSVHPTWRKALIHNVATGGDTPTANSFRELAPDMGAYVNEVNVQDKNAV
jgi:hypothetical protein